MATLIFRVPKDEVLYKQFLENCQLQVLREYKPVKRNIIIQGDGLKMLRNGCLTHVVKIHSIPEQTHYIVIIASRALTFNELVVDHDPLVEHMCVAGEVEQYYSIRKTK